MDYRFLGLFLSSSEIIFLLYSFWYTYLLAAANTSIPFNTDVLLKMGYSSEIYISYSSLVSSDLSVMFSDSFLAVFPGAVLFLYI